MNTKYQLPILGMPEGIDIKFDNTLPLEHALVIWFCIVLYSSLRY